MSFLTAASERSSNGSGASGVSGASFSGASSFFSLSFWTVLVLLAMHHLLERRSRNAGLCGHNSPENIRSPETSGPRRPGPPEPGPLRRKPPVTKKGPPTLCGENRAPLRDRGTDPPDGTRPAEKARTRPTFRNRESLPQCAEADLSPP